MNWSKIEQDFLHLREVEQPIEVPHYHVQRAKHQ
jgi:hypothetical protein